MSTPTTALDAALDARPPREPVRFTFGLTEVQLDNSGAGDGSYTVRGHAAVFNRLSHDMGGFRVRIAPGAFTTALDSDPDVHLVLNHDMRWVLARTRNKTLELREDPRGLHMWARVAPVSYAADARVLLERGDIDQMSFAGLVAVDEWTIDTDDRVIWTIHEFAEITDATICPQGAFPQTDVALVAGRHYQTALHAGRVPGRAADTPQQPDDPAAAATDTPPADAAGGGTEDPARDLDTEAGADDVATEPSDVEALAAARNELREYAHRHLTVARGRNPTR